MRALAAGAVIGAERQRAPPWCRVAGEGRTRRAGCARALRASSRRLVICTIDPARAEGFWPARLFPSYASIDRARFPAAEVLVEELRDARFQSVRVVAFKQPVRHSRDRECADLRGAGQDLASMPRAARFSRRGPGAGPATRAQYGSNSPHQRCSRRGAAASTASTHQGSHLVARELAPAPGASRSRSRARQPHWPASPLALDEAPGQIAASAICGPKGEVRSEDRVGVDLVPGCSQRELSHAGARDD